ncbi:MAG: rhodanese-like domain-containing protein [Anaerolineales bacterium]|nr:rhodanese-like domain-containing protein [Anaerolineales bacterium]
MSQKQFDQWLAGLDLSFWGTAQHKVTPAQFFERQASDGAILLDLRSPEEVSQLAFPFALHIPVNELPKRLAEVPNDRMVATFCSSVTRAVVAWVYLQLNGYNQARILDARYDELTVELLPGKVYKRLR